MRRLLRSIFLPLVAATLLVASVVVAHPHRQIDQQVNLSVGLNRAQLTVRVVPSSEDGAGVFDHIDRDADGTVSAAEASAFGAEVLASITLIVDGTPVRFGEPNGTIPAREFAARGEGVIELRASAQFSLTGGERHSASFEINYGAFAKTWFVQPYFFDDLITATASRSVERDEHTSRVVVRFETKI